MGFERLPKGDIEVQRNELYKSELDRLRKEYPEKNDSGEEVDDEWYKKTALAYADSMLKLKERMKG